MGKLSAVVLVASGLASVCFAQAPANGIGVYFDGTASVNCVSTGLDSLVTGFLILCEPSDSSGVAGWQGRLTADSGIFISNVVLFGQGVLNIGTGGDYMVGFGVPMGWANRMVLASFFVYASAPGGLYFGELSSGGDVCYVAGDGGEPIVAWVMYGDPPGPCATIGLPTCPSANPVPPQVGSGRVGVGGRGPSDVEGTTWGGVKGLYTTAMRKLR